MKKTAVLLCKCKGDHFRDTTYQDTEDYLSGLSIDLFILEDLCAAVLTDHSMLNSLKDRYSSVIILACQPRAVRHLLIQQQISLPDYITINYRDKGHQWVVCELQALAMEPGQAKLERIVSPLVVPAWFPIIDQDRCTNCGSCAKFCLFGVYLVSEGKVSVNHPLNCKNNCPACARSCPSAAIIFPKIAEGGVISGSDEIRQQPQSGIDNRSLAERLSDRSSVRSSVLKASALQQAMTEREDALKDLDTSMKACND